VKIDRGRFASLAQPGPDLGQQLLCLLGHLDVADLGKDLSLLSTPAGIQLQVA
jgi:hypothetical protein